MGQSWINSGVSLLANERKQMILPHYPDPSLGFRLPIFLNAEDAGDPTHTKFFTKPPRVDRRLTNEALHRAMLLAILVGLIQVLLPVVRAGPLSFFISEPILVGLLPGAAIVISASQLPSLLGVTGATDSVFDGAAAALRHPNAWNGFALAVGGISLCAFVASRSLGPRVPLVAATVVGIVVASRTLEFSGPTVGSVDIALVPRLDAVPWAQRRA
jgi:MFS superfamily sulfate permease-like transporter